MRHPLLHTVGFFLSFVSLACLEEPPPMGARPALRVGPVSAMDPAGQPTDLADLARRPTLIVHTSVPIDPLAPPVFLFAGPVDDDLLEDLGRPPLRVKNTARTIPTQLAIFDDAIHVTPDTPLLPGQVLTVAVAAWAVGTNFERWDPDIPPFARTVVVTAGPAGGAAAVASWPAHGTAGVATNLPRIIVAIDGALARLPSELRIVGTRLGSDDNDEILAPVATTPCSRTGLRAHVCVVLELARPLLPLTEYTVEVGPEFIDDTGTPLVPWATTFVTAPSPDRTPPMWLDLPCARDEIVTTAGCAIIGDTEIALRLALSEPVIVHATHQDCGHVTTAAPRGDADVRLQDLQPDTDYHITTVATDAADNTTHLTTLLHTRPPLPRITISEIRADPLGPEPAQEYVELWNHGDIAIDIFGYSVADDPFSAGDTIGRHVLVHARGRALIVADSFDASDARDVMPAPGATLIRIGTSIASGGLANGGEPVFLRDDAGVRLSASPAMPSVGGGVCIRRVDPTSRDGSPGSFVHDGERTCTPGW